MNDWHKIIEDRKELLKRLTRSTKTGKRAEQTAMKDELRSRIIPSFSLIRSRVYRH